MTNAAYRENFAKIDWSKHVPYEPKAREAVQAGNFPCPRVLSDTMPLTEHVDGRFYDSKSGFRAVTKAHGMVEVGNDPARLRPQTKPKADPKKRQEAVQKAVQTVLGA